MSADQGSDAQALEEPDEPAATAAVSKAAQPSTELAEEHIRTGMNVAQTVYAVVMALGLKIAFEALYPVVFAPGSTRPDALSPYLVGLTFLAIMLLALRFFWVTRNLYAYVLQRVKTKEERDVFRPLMLYHVPIALAHAVVFFFICEAFVEMAASAQTQHDPTVHFVAFSAGLLLLNAFWLFAITPKANAFPAGTVWATSNLIHGALVLALLIAFWVSGFSLVALLVASCALLVINSLIDLHQAAEYYILFSR